MPLANKIRHVNASTRPSMAISSRRGRLLGPSSDSNFTPHFAKSRPNAPPITARSRLSVSNCPISRARLAPSAVRIAISRSRTVARASNRLATFADAMSSTNATAPRSTSSAERTSPTIASSSGVTRKLMLELVAGFCCSIRRAMAASSPRACSIVAPGFNRASPVR